jgi:SAM-dependent methyltransferase
MEFRFHEVSWTPELVARFWDAMSRSPLAAGNYFSEQVGPALVNVVRQKVSLGPKVLDYGSGPGHLVGTLLAIPALQVSACEYSEASARELAERFRNAPQFEGCCRVINGRTSYADGTFDTVFFVETLEHLLPTWRDETLKEIGRVLRPGGVAVITTPNSENLVDNMALCPECGAFFHRMQHMGRFDAKELRSLMEKFGFRTIFCDAVQLAHFLPGLGWRGAYRRWKYRKQRRPHLIYIGKKA